MENEFLELDSKFKGIRNLKDLYEEFNSSYVNDPEGATQRLNELIKIYKESKIDIFISFSNLLQKYFDSIINSFTYITIKSDSTYHDSLKRLSNGPMESFNKILSTLRTQSHGVNNFNFVRNRILWATRDAPPILGVPKSLKEIKNNTGKL